MRWAHSQFAKIDIDAAQASQWPRGFVCPLCGRPVDVRSGPLIPPYFAHRRGEGTLECANYYPPVRVARVIGQVQRSSSETAKADLPMLGIIGSAPSDACLVVRIPAAGSADWPGEVKIDTGLGEITITGKTSQTSRWIQVAPMLSYLVSTVGDVDREYASDFTHAPLHLTHEGTLFRYGIEVSRRLWDQESLSWGSSYWWVGKGNLPKWAQLPSSVEIEMRELRSPWILALVTLPHSESLTSTKKSEISDWFGRPMKEEEDGSITFIDPLPNAFDDDGMPVFEDAPQTLQVKSMTNASIELSDRNGTRIVGSNQDTSGVSTLTVESSGVWQVVVNGRRSGHLTVRQCPVPVIPALLLKTSSGSSMCPSTESERLLRAAHANGDQFHLIADSQSLRDLTSVNQTDWPTGTTGEWAIDSRALRSIVVKLRGIGEIRAGLQVDSEKAPLDTDSETLAFWLLSVGSLNHSPGDIGIAVPPSVLTPHLQNLNIYRWDRRFEAHIRLLQSRCSSHGTNP